MPASISSSSTRGPHRSPAPYHPPAHVLPLLRSPWLSERLLLSADLHAVEGAVEALLTVFESVPPRSARRDSHASRLARLRDQVQRHEVQCAELIALVEASRKAKFGNPWGRQAWVARVASPRWFELARDQIPPLIAARAKGYHDAAAVAYACQELRRMTVGDLRRWPGLAEAVGEFLGDGSRGEGMTFLLKMYIGESEVFEVGQRAHGNRLLLRMTDLDACVDLEADRARAALAGGPLDAEPRGPAPAPVVPTPADPEDEFGLGEVDPDAPPLDILELVRPARRETPQHFVKSKVDAAMAGLIGLKEVRRFFTELCWEHLGNRAHVAAGGPKPRPSALHLSLVGPPGVGKTTVAKRYAELLHELGLIRRNHVEVVGARDLIGKYIGSTHPRVLAKAKEAKGGVLFVDEAYALVGGGEKDYGHEAIAALMQAMDTYGDDLVVVLAGYQRPLQRMLNTNPGFASRMGTTLRLRPLDPQQAGRLLIAIARLDGVEIERGVLTSWLDLGMVRELPSDGRAIDLLWQRLRRRVIAPRAARRDERMRLRVRDLAGLRLPPRRDAVDPRWVARVGPDDEAPN
ncbi:MAG: AAA family ATPase [Deltaproteobacteria bacterium]|nr:AAA family ATPase [Deltaproteobacteria bacterium]